MTIIFINIICFDILYKKALVYIFNFKSVNNNYSYHMYMVTPLHIGYTCL